eukprot:4609328-Prymnesium_polylepis.1
MRRRDHCTALGDLPIWGLSVSVGRIQQILRSLCGPPGRPCGSAVAFGFAVAAVALITTLDVVARVALVVVPDVQRCTGGAPRGYVPGLR